MKKRVLAVAIATAVLSVGMLSGCFLRRTVSVTSIEKTNSVGLVDYYTVYYSDGTTSFFTVTNGANGTNASGITVRDVYEEYKSVYGDGLTYEQFCEKFLAGAKEDAEVHTALNTALRSAVAVYSVHDFKEYGRVNKGFAGGSGVIYKMDEEYTYILTNYHVVYEKSAYGPYKISSEIHAYLYGSESYPKPNSTYTGYDYDGYAIECDYIGGAISYDVAVLRAKTEDVTKINPDVVPVTVNCEYAVGDATYAVGNPELAGISVTEGLVSVDSEYILLAIDGQERPYRSIRTDAMITHGSSGGGLFNMRGELIGLTNAGSEEICFMNYSIPSVVLTGIADGVIHYYNGSDGRYRGTYKMVLGVTSQAENSRYAYDVATGSGRLISDIKITEVSADGLGESMGFKVGDVLRSVSINGVETEVYRLFHVSDLMLTVRAGDRITFTYERDGEKGTTSELFVQSSHLEKVD